MKQLRTTTDARSPELDRISWWDGDTVRTTRVANAQRLDRVVPTKRARKAPKYKGQLSFQGHYWFAGLKQMVWHESMAESAWLMMIDHMRLVTAIAAQPFVLEFADGTTHVPDFFTHEAATERTVFDIHPVELTTDRDLVAFANTRRVCDDLGYDYVVVDQMPDVTAWNLEMLARYRHPMFQPTPKVRQRILRAASTAPRFGDLRLKLQTSKTGELVPALIHLMWQQELLIDLDHVITDDTAVTVA